MQLNLVLQEGGQLFPVKGDTISFGVPCVLEVIERKPNEIIFGIKELPKKPDINNFKDRKCYMMELDERYCDVIIKRYEDFTGNKAKKL